MNGYRPTVKWHAADRQAFRDGVRQRAATIPSHRHAGPSAAEWDYDESEEA